MNYKKEIDEILNTAPDYLDKLKNKVLVEFENKELSFLRFCLEYLPYSISEELILVARKTIFNLSKEDWTSLVQNMSFNPEYGNETLRRFFRFHTAMTPEELNESGMKTAKTTQETEETGDYHLLKKDHPKIMKFYASLGLDDTYINQLHHFKI